MTISEKRVSSWVANPHLSETDFSAIAGILRKKTGIDLSPSKRPLVEARLSHRIRALGLDGFARYRSLIDAANGSPEFTRMVSALTTNLTRFNREPDHLEDLRREVLPECLRRAHAGGRVRLWSAGCSTGEEAYDLAFALLALDASAPLLDIRILATDIDPVVLEVAATGIYSKKSLGGFSPDEIARNFSKNLLDAAPYDRDKFSVSPEAKKMLAFRQLNLLDAWPFAGQFDVIMCRNVIIYFDIPTQEQLWPRFHDRLTPNGCLYLGHSECITGPARNDFNRVDRAGYNIFAKHDGVEGHFR